ncbi:hypothetical protein F5051DRAFT_434188 [Lentinula edodes]|nr:hypothetical protein F5051DRAFT_434188 [Lentinula edodes]
MTNTYFPPQHLYPKSFRPSFMIVWTNNGEFPLKIVLQFEFQEGSAIMRLVPLKDLDPFAALRSSTTETRPLPGDPRVSSPVEDSLESSEEDRSVAPPKRNKLTSQRRSSCTSQASSSKKKVEKPVPKPKATAWSKTTVKMVEESRAAKGKARQMEVLEVKESETEEEVVPPPSKRLKSSKSAPNSMPLQRQNPIFDVNPEFLELGTILTTQKASFTMQDLLQINHSICDPSIPAQACVSALSRGEFTLNSSCLPGLKCESCFSRSLKCMCSLDVDLAMDALNALHVATTSSTINLTNSLRCTQELCTQLDRLGTDPIVVLEALKAAEPQRESLSVEDWTLLATLFQWSSPFNLNGLKFDNRMPAEWIDLLCSIHSGTPSAEITPDGHLVDTLQPPEPAVKVSEAPLQLL